ncbi:MAG: carboxypeptidase regulatory-like domain-containing protein [Candidatus Firestonebacteria bacterium]
MKRKYCINTIIWIFIFLLLPLYSYAGFRLTTLDTTGDIGKYTSIAIDRNDKVHISYYDETNGDLKYATNVSGNWVYYTIDNIGNVGTYTSIAIDRNDKVHISYYDETNDGLKYATNVSGNWVYFTIDNEGQPSGRYSSIAIDGNNKVHISYNYYLDNMSHGLKYITNSSGSWVSTDVNSNDGSGAGGFTSIAIDSNNKVHISSNGGTLQYTTNISGEWKNYILDSTSGSVYGYSSTSIAIDKNDKIHISYYYEGLKYATNVSGLWICLTLDTPITLGYFSDIAIDSNNKVHIAYKDGNAGGLKYVTNSSGPWQISSIQGSFDGGYVNRGLYPAIAIDSKDKIHVGFYDASNGNLKYAGPNIVPVLTWTGEANYTIDGMNPDVVKQGENVTFRIKYSDADGDVPASGYPKVHIKKGTSEVVVYPMTYVNGDYSTGAIYTCTFALSLSAAEDYSYYFEAKDVWNDSADNTQDKAFTILGVSYGVITGKVTRSPDGVTVISGATVQLLQNGVLKGETKTDGSGNYSIANVGIGKYDVLVSAIGYSISMQTGKEVREGETTTVNFALSEGNSTIIIITSTEDDKTKISISSDENVYFSFAKRQDITDGIGYELIMKDKNSNAKLENFSKPVTLTIHWTVANGKVANTEVSEYEVFDKLAIYYYDGVRWQKVGGLVDPVEQTVSVSTSKAGVYAIKSSASMSYGGRILVYPNPFTPNGDGVNDSVGFYFDANPTTPEIKIYKGSGRLVRTLDGVTSWDGKDDSGSVVEAGLYLYHFRLGDTNKTGTVVVAK